MLLLFFPNKIDEISTHYEIRFTVIYSLYQLYVECFTFYGRNSIWNENTRLLMWYIMIQHISCLNKIFSIQFVSSAQVPSVVSQLSTWKHVLCLCDLRDICFTVFFLITFGILFVSGEQITQTYSFKFKSVVVTSRHF